MTLILFTKEAEKSLRECVHNKMMQALLQNPEAKAQYAEGCLRVRQMAARRRAMLLVDPDLRKEKITI